MTGKKQRPSTQSTDAPRGYASPPCYQHELDPDYVGHTDADRHDVPGDPESWEAIRQWRVKTRARLKSYRDNLTEIERKGTADAITRHLHESGLLTGHHGIGFYWPMASEIDLRPMMTDLALNGIELALPVIVGAGKPLEFRRWHPDDVLDDNGTWGIPAPSGQPEVAVTLLLVPTLGFDNAGHRLGHGGGYYDRTLGVMNPRPTAVGIGYEACRLPTIYAQPHDIPMDAIVTDCGVINCGRR